MPQAEGFPQGTDDDWSEPAAKTEGTFFGALVGVLTALNVETIVGKIEQVLGMKFLSPEVYYISNLPSDMHWVDVWRISIVALVLSLVATIYPAWRASRTQPAEALRYE